MSGPISFKHKGNFDKTEKFLNKMAKRGYFLDAILRNYAIQGVQALRSATPVRTGKTAASWGYEIEKGNGYAKIIWTNSNRSGNGGWCPIALLIQYGHGTGTGGYVQGRDYINPAIRPTFDKMANAVWKEVTEA